MVNTIRITRKAQHDIDKKRVVRLAFKILLDLFFKVCYNFFR